mgnify:CR=1 FL=1
MCSIIILCALSLAELAFCALSELVKIHFDDMIGTLRIIGHASRK